MKLIDNGTHSGEDEQVLNGQANMNFRQICPRSRNVGRPVRSCIRGCRLEWRWVCGWGAGEVVQGCKWASRTEGGADAGTRAAVKMSVGGRADRVTASASHINPNKAACLPILSVCDSFSEVTQRTL